MSYRFPYCKKPGTSDEPALQHSHSVTLTNLPGDFKSENVERCQLSYSRYLPTYKPQVSCKYNLRQRKQSCERFCRYSFSTCDHSSFEFLEVLSQISYLFISPVYPPTCIPNRPLLLLSETHLEHSPSDFNQVPLFWVSRKQSSIEHYTPY